MLLRIASCPSLKRCLSELTLTEGTTMKVLLAVLTTFFKFVAMLILSGGSEEKSNNQYGEFSTQWEPRADGEGFIQVFKKH